MDVRSAPFASPHVEYVGAVQGKEKARLLARARALLFPGHPLEAFDLVVAEALISGTPVIAGDGGSFRELVQPKVGFVCGTLDAHVHAIANSGRISSAVCRTYAEREFHYQVMTRRYLAEYETELAR